MTSVFGLPAHPLFAHIPVVLIPLAALGTVAMLWPPIRDRIGWIVVGVVFVAGVCCQIAISTGQSLKDYVRETKLMHDHVRLGETIRPWVLFMFLALLAVMAIAHRTNRSAATDKTSKRRAPEPHDRLWYAGIAAMGCSLFFAVVATYTIVRIGHSGSKAVWQPTQVKIDAGRSHAAADSDDR